MEQEVINVCRESFVSSAEISCVTMEHRGIDNLYSSDAVVRSRGLKVERFIRPPFTMTFQFKPLVHLTHIVLHTDCDHEGDVCRLQVSVTRANQSTQQYLKSCGMFVVSPASRVSVLHNKLWVRPDFELPNTVLGSHLHTRLLGEQPHSQTLHSTHPLRAVKHIVMTILHMSGAKPFGLKALEVWAVPSSDGTVFEECKSAAARDEPRAASSIGLYQVDHSTSEACIRSNSDMEMQQVQSTKHAPKCGPDSIPEHFLDKLTYQLMVLPMVLPSGHYVDQTTAEKTQELDLLYGRPPSDPFTGIPYSDRQKPRFAPHLKAEIDAYVVVNNSFVEGYRTVGSAEDITKHRSQLGNDKAIIILCTLH